MNHTFQQWKKIDGLIKIQGDFALVDRMALRESYRGGNLKRWQVIDESQEWYRTFKSLQAAVQCLEDNKGDSNPNLRRVG
jgi:hypothetical protein